MDRQPSIATRHSLLSRLKDWDDAESWRQFFNIYWRLIYQTATRAGLSESEAQEVVQETTITVAKNLKNFKYDPQIGSFKGWLLQTTHWRINDQMRKRRAQLEPLPATSINGTRIENTVPDPAPAMDQVWEKDWRENIAEAALERVRERLPVKQFQAFDLYVTRGWPVTKVARTVGVNVAQIYLLKFRVTKLLKAEVQRLERELI